MMTQPLTPGTGSFAAREAEAIAADNTPDDWVHLIRSEYLEIPGLRLTNRQAQRLWNLEASVCDTLLASLIADGFLRRTHDGAFVRADSSVR